MGRDTEKGHVHLGDCKNYNKLDLIPRKRKSIDFFCEIPQTKRGKLPPGKTKACFFSMKTCWNYALKVPFTTYWTCCISCKKIWTIFENWPHQIWSPSWNHWMSYVPKTVLKPSLGIDSIQKCLWILCKKFNFQTTKKLNYKHVQCLKRSLKALLETKFPMLISVESKFATYHHVVVVWREMVIDYESMFMYPLTEDILRQICGVNTTFHQIGCGYGILPS